MYWKIRERNMYVNNLYTLCEAIGEVSRMQNCKECRKMLKNETKHQLGVCTTVCRPISLFLQSFAGNTPFTPNPVSTLWYSLMNILINKRGKKSLYKKYFLKTPFNWNLLPFCYSDVLIPTNYIYYCLCERECSKLFRYLETYIFR